MRTEPARSRGVLGQKIPARLYIPTRVAPLIIYHHQPPSLQVSVAILYYTDMPKKVMEDKRVNR